MRAHLEPRYLLPESFDLLYHLVTHQPVLGTLLVLGVFGVVLLILKKLFGRIAYDMVIFAVLITGLLLVLGSAGYLLLHVEGFRFGG